MNDKTYKERLLQYIENAFTVNGRECKQAIEANNFTKAQWLEGKLGMLAEMRNDINADKL